MRRKIGESWRTKDFIHVPRLHSPGMFTEFRLGPIMKSGKRFVYGKHKKTGKWIRQSTLTPIVKRKKSYKRKGRKVKAHRQRYKIRKRAHFVLVERNRKTGSERVKVERETRDELEKIMKRPIWDTYNYEFLIRKKGGKNFGGLFYAGTRYKAGKMPGGTELTIIRDEKGKPVWSGFEQRVKAKDLKAGSGFGTRLSKGAEQVRLMKLGPKRHKEFMEGGENWFK
jgi:hypothetical protein